MSPTKEIILPTDRPPRVEVSLSAQTSTPGAENGEVIEFNHSFKESRDWACTHRLSRANAEPASDGGDRSERGFGAKATTLAKG